MRALSLFSGCGGLDLAAEAAGIEIVGQCEIDEACNRVLGYWWPNVPRWRDVHDVTGAGVLEHCGAVDLVFGGPPCQPVSVAGRRGAAGDSRNMWPEFIRAIREIRPRWIVAENPTGIISAQKIKGDARTWPKGEFFGEVVRDITALGYSVGWGVWGARDVGAPHKRERVFVLAHRQSVGRGAWRAEQSRQQGRRNPASSGGGAMADPESQQFDRAVSPRRGRSGSPDSGDVVDTEHAGLYASEIPGGLAETVYEHPTGPKYPGESPGTGSPGMLPGQPVADTYGGGAGQHVTERRPADRKVIVLTGSGSPSGELDVADSGGQQRGIYDRPAELLEERRSRLGRCPQPGVGGDPDGVPARVDFPGWPAGRGAEQYPWEPPRVVPGKSVAERTRKIKMLGNAVVPQQAVILFSAIVRSYEP